MEAVEHRFDTNVAFARRSTEFPIDLHKHKGKSRDILPTLLAGGYRSYFDLVYIDGSHQAADVLFDAVLCFDLLKKDGVLIFDDYLWQMEERGAEDHYNLPKPAIDAFVNIYRRKLDLLSAPLYQFYVQKLAD